MKKFIMKHILLILLILAWIYPCYIVGWLVFAETKYRIIKNEHLNVYKVEKNTPFGWQDHSCELETLKEAQKKIKEYKEWEERRKLLKKGPWKIIND